MPLITIASIERIGLDGQIEVVESRFEAATTKLDRGARRQGNRIRGCEQERAVEQAHRLGFVAVFERGLSRAEVSQGIVGPLFQVCGVFGIRLGESVVDSKVLGQAESRPIEVGVPQSTAR